MITRADLEQLEEHSLALYASKASRSRGRAHAEPEDPFRTCYQRDRDRLIHTGAFRRLEYKTQVFVNQEGDYYRTRLTHSLEVSQIARSIARPLGLNEDLVETLALAHDLGHPPFGHAGEAALKEAMAEHGGFEHNAQALRIVDLLERRYPHFRGINLTFEVRESLLKGRGDARSLLGDAALERPGRSPCLEAQVVDVADSIAYDHHDLDDGLASQIFDEEDLHSVALFREAREAVEAAHPGIDRKQRRHRVVSYLIDRAITDLVEHSGGALERSGVDSPEEARALPRPLIGFSSKTKEKLEELEAFLQEKFYGHYRLSRSQTRGKRFVRELFDEFCREPSQLPPEFRAWADEQGIERGVCDYIAGMTDRYAEREYRQLFHPFERV